MSTPPFFGPYGSSALETIERFTSYGANAFWFHMFNPEALEACQKLGISACVEFKTLRADFAQHPEWVPIGVDGQPIRFGKLVQGVCLSQTAFLEETEAHLLDGVRTYQPDGIWLDYLTYAGWFETPTPDLQDSCFCPRCIADFCESTGLDLDRPDQILREASQAWMQHKCERIAALARHYAQVICSHLPGCIIGAYMCPWLPDEYDSALARIFAQDYSLLAPAIDVFTPLIYTTKSGRPSTWGRDFLEASPAFVPQNRKVQLILDVLDYPDSLLAITESHIPSWGLQMYGGASVFKDPSQAALFARAADRIRSQLGRLR